ncbi:response regulator transcription factor [Sedimenticola thiotaurini]|uniref:Response regulator transcription factor n=1 Tax=Sedimenticola thiotaurini TaxID=1543721 RepID=A0A0F7JSU4_9GAMM|nr:response regulator transcription factor [Sedimenticola thiotaurini]AKH19526.1 hypothetical protein AAY24_03220 [Sedimenticola thiotaurini]
MSDNTPNVFIVDDDLAVRESLSDLMDSVGLNAETYASAQEFLTRYTPTLWGCLVLDIRMFGMSGLELQDELIRRGALLPTIFITGHGDVPMAVQAMRRGAMDFIQKPFREQELLDSINLALENGSKIRASELERQTVWQQVESLTPREREVMDKIIAGKSNKVIAADLGLSQRTVEVHRANMMEKLQVHSLADLVRVITHAGLDGTEHQVYSNG